MRFPQWYARWNSRVTNKFVRLWAGRVPGYGLLTHHGRTSGRRYTTPLNVFTTADGYAVFLPYGADKTQWLKNITATGTAEINRHGKTTTIDSPRITTKQAAAPAVNRPWRTLFRRAPFTEVVLLRSVSGTETR